MIVSIRYGAVVECLASSIESYLNDIRRNRKQGGKVVGCTVTTLGKTNCCFDRNLFSIWVDAMLDDIQSKITAMMRQVLGFFALFICLIFGVCFGH